MKVYYSVLHDNLEIIDDYVIETDFIVIQFDAQTGTRIQTYNNLAEYMMITVPKAIVEVEY